MRDAAHTRERWPACGEGPCAAASTAALGCVWARRPAMGRYAVSRTRGTGTLGATHVPVARGVRGASAGATSLCAGRADADSSPFPTLRVSCRADESRRGAERCAERVFSGPNHETGDLR